MKTICIFNLKGGVGKTMTTANLAYLLATKWRKSVLCIDADSQCNLTQYLGVTAEDGATIVDLLKGTFEGYNGLIPQTQFHGIGIIPAKPELMGYDVTAVTTGRAHGEAINELRKAILRDPNELNAVDYILIDCPPAFTASASAALIAADEVIIPVRLDAFSTAGMADMMEQIKNMKRINPRIKLRGILVTQFMNTPEEGTALEWLRTQSGLPVFDRVIRHSKRVSGSTFAREPLEIFSKTCSAAIDYRHLAINIVVGDENEF